MKSFLPPMDSAKEKMCLQAMQTGSVEAKNQLIERNMRLVAHVAKKYQNPEEDMEELISIGTIGLIKAVQTFDVTRKNKLASYAARCIDNELLMYFRAKKKKMREVSLYDPIGTDKEGNQIQYFDVIESEDVDVVAQMEQNHKISELYRAIPAVLTPREAQIISQRYGLYGKKELTQREIAAKIGISRSYVSRIEKKALKKLRVYFEKGVSKMDIV
ncbi:MAG: RNA polymerase sporulation sigma factor SigK [Lachnospiraceae bacterium]